MGFLGSFVSKKSKDIAKFKNSPLGFALGSYFGSKKKKALKAAKHNVAQGKASLLSEVKTTDLIDERTREEFVSQFSNDYVLNYVAGGGGQKGAVKKAGGILNSFASLLGEAQEGVSAKFKSRMATQQLFNSMVDTPDSQRLRGGILNFGSAVRK